MTNTFWKELDQAVDEHVRAVAQVEVGSEAGAFLNNRHVEAWFKDKIRAIAQEMLKPETQDADLPRWKARAAALLDFYTSLTAKVAAGDLAAQRMAAEATKKEQKEQKES